MSSTGLNKQRAREVYAAMLAGGTAKEAIAGLGFQVVADTIGVRDQAGRSVECQDWGIDMLFLHFGADQRRAAPDQDTVRWVDEVQSAVTVPVGVATFDATDAVAAARKGVQLVAIGHPIVGTDAASAERLRRYVDAVKSAV